MSSYRIQETLRQRWSELSASGYCLRRQLSMGLSCQSLLGAEHSAQHSAKPLRFRTSPRLQKRLLRVPVYFRISRYRVSCFARRIVARDRVVHLHAASCQSPVDSQVYGIAFDGLPPIVSLAKLRPIAAPGVAGCRSSSVPCVFLPAVVHSAGQQISSTPARCVQRAHALTALQHRLRWTTLG